MVPRPAKRDVTLLLLWFVIATLAVPTMTSNPSVTVFSVALSFILAVAIWTAGYLVWLGVRRFRRRAENVEVSEA